MAVGRKLTQRARYMRQFSRYILPLKRRIKNLNIIHCKKCKQVQLGHTICSNCK